MIILSRQDPFILDEISSWVHKNFRFCSIWHFIIQTTYFAIIFYKRNSKNPKNKLLQKWFDSIFFVFDPFFQEFFGNILLWELQRLKSWASGFKKKICCLLNVHQTRGRAFDYHVSREVSLAPTSFAYTAITFWKSNYRRVKVITGEHKRDPVTFAF